MAHLQVRLGKPAGRLPAAGSWADRSPLHEAAFHGQLLALMTLVAQVWWGPSTWADTRGGQGVPGFSVNIVTMEKVSPLHDACLGGRVSCARFLLEKGAAVSVGRTEPPHRYLMLKSERLFHSHLRQVNATTIDGVTPLFSACRGGSPACVQLLLDHGSALHPTHGSALLVASPIHEAAERGHWECMEILIAHGVDLDLEIPKLGTPLYISCVSQKVHCVERLLQLGADACRGRGQDTPLHAAARQTDVHVVELLIDYGADVWSRDGEGRRPVELAMPLSLVEAELLLREHPPALSQLCRLHIRHVLGSVRLHLAPNLGLPSHLYSFLFYRPDPGSLDHSPLGHGSGTSAPSFYFLLM
ncbi:ankyrin repeat and SOCS box protein 11 isoform X2 [Paramormyrops kingsleyae]|uniref:ankyrin repeat and SOCS box protein 11 isoform X2 n=1 Tax=Paramormyrops kingsleyae TaxID=1676925 RepID=UPI003B97A39B